MNILHFHNFNRKYSEQKWNYRTQKRNEKIRKCNAFANDTDTHWNDVNIIYILKKYTSSYSKWNNGSYNARKKRYFLYRNDAKSCLSGRMIHIEQESLIDIVKMVQVLNILFMLVFKKFWYIWTFSDYFFFNLYCFWFEKKQRIWKIILCDTFMYWK